MAYMPGGSVRKRLDRDGAFSENKCKEYTYQILEGLAYLHRQHIMHRDLKGSILNLLLVLYVLYCGKFSLHFYFEKSKI